MRRFSSHFFALGLVAQLAVFACVSPILVLCTCQHGQAAVAVSGHEQPACGDHEHAHDKHEQHGQSDHGDPQDDDHRDEPLPSRELLPNKSATLTWLAPAAMPVALVDTFTSPIAAPQTIDHLHRTGPPEPLRLSIRCTILLI